MHRRFCWAARLTVLACALSPAPALARSKLELSSLLARPGVRLAVVGFWAPWSKDATDELTRARRLVERFADRGVRLVVVSTGSPEGGCATPPFDADELVCDDRGLIAAAWGADEALPATHVFTWQGRALAARADASTVTRAVEGFFAAPQEVVVGQVDLGGSADTAQRLAQGLTRALAAAGKLVVRTEAESTARPRESAPRCDGGARALGASTRLEARLEPRTRLLVIEAVSNDEGCVLATAAARYDPDALDGCAKEAVARIHAALRSPPEPGARRAEASRSLEPSQAEEASSEDLDVPPPSPLRPVELAALLELETPPVYEGLGVKILELVERSYVDPSRTRPERMLRGALATLATVVPGLSVERTAQASFRVRLGSSETTVSVRETVDLSELAGELERVSSLVVKDRARRLGRTGVDVVLLDGALATLDARTRVLTPPELSASGAKLALRAGGIGADLTMKNGVLRIVQPLAGGPAAKAGLLSGDVLKKIDDQPTSAMSFDEALDRIRGEIGTKLAITVMREGWKEPVRYGFVRGIVEPRPLETRRLADGIGYVRVKTLQDSMLAELPDQLARLSSMRRGLHGLVLDLRDVPVGSMDAAVRLADAFLGKGELAALATRDRRELREAHADAGDVRDQPMAVLVNRNTAWAAELVAGTLAAAERAVVLGEPTRGQASVMSTHPVGHGFGLSLRTAEWLIAGGKRLEGVGLSPDLVLAPRSARGASPALPSGALLYEFDAPNLAEEREQPIEVARQLLVKHGHPERRAMVAALPSFVGRGRAAPTPPQRP